MINKTPLSDFVRKIEDRKPFTFSRWGDGEWQSVLGRVKGVNCDRHTYFPEMGERLRNVLRARPRYMLGMQNFTMRGQLGPRVTRWLSQEGLDDLTWHDADVFHYAAIKEKLDPLLAAIREVPVVMVGPDHLKRINKTIPYVKFVDVPPKNAFLSLERITRDCLAAVDDRQEFTLISISAGMPAEILIHDLYPKLGKRHALVDFGSLWDPYVGVESRSYMRNRKRK